MIDFELDADSVVASNEQLQELSNLLAMRAKLAAEIASLEENLKLAKRKFAALNESDIPSVLDAAGLQMVMLDDGRTVKIKESLYMSIPAKNKPSAVRWLLTHGHAAVVREDVVVAFDKGDTEEAATLAASLSEQGFDVNMAETVSTNTVRALARELMSQGQEFPLELFGGYIKREAVVK